MKRKIIVRETLDWGCEHTPGDVTSFESEVACALASLFPDTEIDVSCELRYQRLVIVTTRTAEGRIDTSATTANAEHEIEQAAHEVCQETWDRGSFWGES